VICDKYGEEFGGFGDACIFRKKVNCAERFEKTISDAEFVHGVAAELRAYVALQHGHRDGTWVTVSGCICIRWKFDDCGGDGFSRNVVKFFAGDGPGDGQRARAGVFTGVPVFCLSMHHRRRFKPNGDQPESGVVHWDQTLEECNRKDTAEHSRQNFKSGRERYPGKKWHMLRDRTWSTRCPTRW